MEEKQENVLVIASIYLDEKDWHELTLYENVTKLVEKIDKIEDETILQFISQGRLESIDCSDVEWYRFVSTDSHLANYVRSGDRYGCEWDLEGNRINEETR